VTGIRRPVLLLGGSGFIGHAALRHLFERGDHVIALAQRQRPHLLENPNITWIFGDLRDTSLLGRLFSMPPGAIIYAAGSHTPADSSRDPAADLETNLLPLVRCLELAIAAKVDRLVYISSGGTVYGSTVTPAREEMSIAPVNAYGLAKASSEKYIALMTRNTSLVPAILRVSNVYGPEQLPKPGFGFIPTAILRALNEEPIPLFNGGRDIRDYVFVDDVIAAILSALDDERPMTLNIGSGVGASGLDVVKTLEDVLGKPVQIHLEGSRVQDVTSVVLNVERAQHLLGWRPMTALHAGLASTVAWLSQRLKSSGESRYLVVR
jgi:UDP-glucose 4-epimerase